MRLSLASLVVASGCGLFPDLGSLGQDASSTDAADAADAAKEVSVGDGSAGDGASDGLVGSIQIVQSSADSTSSTATSLPITINASGSGNLIVVALTQESGTTPTITGVTDDASGGSNAYVSANERSVDSSCGNTAEIWYARATKSGAKTVTVAMNGNVGFEVWVAEFSGISTQNPLVIGGSTSSASTATILAPETTLSAVPAVVVSVASTCGAISAIHTGNPFTALTIQGGEDSAYAIVSMPGTYGAEWSYSGGTWNATTVAFR